MKKVTKRKAEQQIWLIKIIKTSEFLNHIKLKGKSIGRGKCQPIGEKWLLSLTYKDLNIYPQHICEQKHRENSQNTKTK